MILREPLNELFGHCLGIGQHVFETAAQRFPDRIGGGVGNGFEFIPIRTQGQDDLLCIGFGLTEFECYLCRQALLQHIQYRRTDGLEELIIRREAGRNGFGNRVMRNLITNLIGIGRRRDDVLDRLFLERIKRGLMIAEQRLHAGRNPVRRLHCLFDGLRDDCIDMVISKEVSLFAEIFREGVSDTGHHRVLEIVLSFQGCEDPVFSFFLEARLPIYGAVNHHVDLIVDPGIHRVRNDRRDRRHDLLDSLLLDGVHRLSLACELRGHLTGYGWCIFQDRGQTRLDSYFPFATDISGNTR